MSYCAWRLWNLKRYVPENVMLAEYRSLVESTLNYGATAWGLASDYKIEKLQNLQDKCVKTLLGKNSTLPTEQIYETLELLKVKSLVKYKLIKISFHFSIQDSTRSFTRKETTKKLIGIKFHYGITNMGSELLSISYRHFIIPYPKKYHRLIM